MPGRALRLVEVAHLEALDDDVRRAGDRDAERARGLAVDDRVAGAPALLRAAFEHDRRRCRAARGDRDRAVVLDATLEQHHVAGRERRRGGIPSRWHRRARAATRSPASSAIGGVAAGGEVDEVRRRAHRQRRERAQPATCGWAGASTTGVSASVFVPPSPCPPQPVISTASTSLERGTR